MFYGPAHVTAIKDDAYRLAAQLFEAGLKNQRLDIFPVSHGRAHRLIEEVAILVVPVQDRETPEPVAQELGEHVPDDAHERDRGQGCGADEALPAPGQRPRRAAVGNRRGNQHIDVPRYREAYCRRTQIVRCERKMRTVLLRRPDRKDDSDAALDRIPYLEPRAVGHESLVRPGA